MGTRSAFVASAAPACSWRAWPVLPMPRKKVKRIRGEDQVRGRERLQGPERLQDREERCAGQNGCKGKGFLMMSRRSATPRRPSRRSEEEVGVGDGEGTRSRPPRRRPPSVRPPRDAPHGRSVPRCRRRASPAALRRVLAAPAPRALGVDCFEAISENYMVPGGRPLARAGRGARALPGRAARRLAEHRLRRPARRRYLAGSPRSRAASSPPGHRSPVLDGRRAAATCTTSCRCPSPRRRSRTSPRASRACRTASAAASRSRTSPPTSPSAPTRCRSGSSWRGRGARRLRDPARREQRLRLRAQPRLRRRSLSRRDPARARVPDPPRGPHEQGALLIDTHDHPVRDEVWALYESARAPARSGLDADRVGRPDPGARARGRGGARARDPDPCRSKGAPGMAPASPAAPRRDAAWLAPLYRAGGRRAPRSRGRRSDDVAPALERGSAGCPPSASGLRERLLRADPRLLREDFGALARCARDAFHDLAGST